MVDILKIADNIINKRSEEKEREYGPIDDSLNKVALIATELCNKKITLDDVYKIMISLKLSRMAYNHKDDTYIDMVAYITAFYNYKNKQNEKNNNQNNGKKFISRTKNKKRNL